MTLTFDGVTAHRFCAFIATSGTSSAVQGLWVIQGYGSGGTRYRLENLITGNSASVEISGANITISNSSTAYMYASLHFLYGNGSYYSVVE